MCLGIPVKIVSIDGNTALASVSGVKRKIGIELTPDARAGDYVLLHAGFAIEKISKKDARKTLKLLEEMFSKDVS